MTFAELLAQYKTKRAIADATGYHYRTVWGWEKAGKIPASAIAKIAAAPTGSPSLSTESGAGAAATE